ncbi:RNA polymerase sigma factor [Agromyces sp. H66]|uniref:RNA polymerase sigma factor n=1 Tax=Agromyces sp. H66 TaxID=2529859 RepID=UPI00145A1EB9|nr:RNA polymerase sigma factor [Agromyces sp. H66]
MSARDRAQDRRFETAVRQNVSDILAYLERRIDPAADAADILSDALFTAWKKRADMPFDDAALRPWLFAFARNTLLNARRAARRRTAATNELRNFLTQSQSGTKPSTEGAVEIRMAVAKLPDDHRELIELVHWEGLSVAEAANVLDIPPSTARSRYATAKRLLLAVLDPAGTAV